MGDQRDLFQPGGKGKTTAPERLNPAQWRRLEAWAEEVVPWVSRGALGCFETLESLAAEVLEWWQGEGRGKLDWVATIQNRIRRVERGRLQTLAREGNLEAREALRDTAGWRDRYDRLQSQKPTGSAPASEPFTPRGGTVLHLGRNPRR